MQFDLKKCSRCKEEKHFSEFNKDKQKSDGLRYECRSCQSKYRLTYSGKIEMRLHKFQAIYNGLSSVAKKVYGATPASEAWSGHKIKDELSRTKTPTDLRIILGCLNTLIDVGLVKERPAGFFQRIAVDAKVEKRIDELSTDEQAPESTKEIDMNTNASQTPVASQATGPQATIADPIEKIGQLAQQCKEVIEQVQRLASNIETVAIEVQDIFSARDEDVQKLKQLQKLLKSLG